MKKSGSLMILLIIFAASIPGVPSGAASTIYVPGDYQTIQDAIDRASEGDTIRVASGVYNETISSSNRKGISIIGENRETTFITGVAPNSPYNIRIHSDGYRISGFTIQGSVLFDSVGSRVEDNVIEDGFINLSNDCVGVTVKNNVMESGVQITGSGNYIEDNICDMIVIKYEGGNYLTGNTVNEITIRNAPNNVLRDNDIVDTLSIIGDSNLMLVQDIDESNTLRGASYLYNANYTIYNVPQDYTTIQEAVDAASEGGIINVAPGTYYENVLIGRDKVGLKLIGEDKATTFLDGSSGDYSVKVEPVDAEITGFTFINGKTGIHVNDFGINCFIHDNTLINRTLAIKLGAAGAIVESNIITECKSGILGHYRGGCKILNNNVTKTSSLSITLRGGNNIVTGNLLGNVQFDDSYYNQLRNNSMQSLYIRAIPRCEIDDCTIYYIHDIDTTNTIDGIPVYYLKNQHDKVFDASSFPDVKYLAFVNSTNLQVKNLKINHQTLMFAHSANITVTNIMLNGSALRLHSSINITIKYCIFTNTSATRIRGESSGLIFYGSSDNKAFGNDFSKCMTAIYLSYSDSNQILNNSLNANIYAVYSWVSEGNQLYGNNFIDNSAQFLTYQNYTQFWDNGYNQGNYWSDYIGDDADGNGIGDTPYIIDVYNQDNYPLMSPIEFSFIPIEDEQDTQPPEEPPEPPEETTPEDTTPDETTETQEEETGDDERKGIPGFSTISILIGVMLGLILFSGATQSTLRSPL